MNALEDGDKIYLTTKKGRILVEKKPFLKKPGPVGQRTIKTAATAAILAAVYYMIGRNPAFACIGVIFGMGSDVNYPDSKESRLVTHSYGPDVITR